MIKLLSLSLLVSVIAIPTLAARASNPRRGLKLAVVWMGVVAAAYLLVLRELPPPR